MMPKTELITTQKSNLGKGLFARWRYFQKVFTNSGFEFNFQIDKNQYDYYTSAQSFVEHTLVDIDVIQSFQQKNKLRKPWLYPKN